MFDITRHWGPLSRGESTRKYRTDKGTPLGHSRTYHLAAVRINEVHEVRQGPRLAFDARRDGQDVNPCEVDNSELLIPAPPRLGVQEVSTCQVKP